MRNVIITVAIIAILGGGAYYYFQAKELESGTTVAQSGTVPSTTNLASPGQESPDSEDTASDGSKDESVKLDEEGSDAPATERYKNAEEALAAVKAGAADFDDRIIDQFTLLPQDCSFCESLFASLKELLNDPKIPNEQKSFYAELFAVSGRVENVATLVDGIRGAPTPESALVLQEALELTVGKDDVTKYLGEQLSSANNADSLRESLVTAITNQGTRDAVDLLYKHTVARGDPDGYYSVGIGLGELVPDESAMPYLQELVQKRDQYSHLAVDSLLNAGLDGLKLVMGTLANSQNVEEDKKLFRNALEHTSFGEETKEYLKNYVQNSRDELTTGFASQALNAIKADEEAALNDSGEENMTPVPVEENTSEAQ